MKWIIEVRPTSAALDSWKWHAQAEDGESVLVGDVNYSTSETALTVARERVAAVEGRRSTIEAAVITEEYTPSVAEILAAR